MSIFDLKWIKKLPYGNFLIVFITPLLILSINQLLLLAIDFIGILNLILAYFEKHYTHSRSQQAIFTKALFYLLLNMLIIPGITMTTVGNRLNDI